MLGISKFCHTSDLLKVLNLFDIDSLVIFMKLSFVKNLKNNKLSYKIFVNLLNNIETFNVKSKSFIVDYKKISNSLNYDYNFIFNNTISVINDFKNNYYNSNSDDINFNLIKSALQNNDQKERHYYLNLVLNF